MAVVKNLMVRAGADFSAMTKETGKAQKTLVEFKKSTSGVMKGIATALAALGIGKVIKDAASSAMNVESSIGQIDRVMGQSAQSFKSWAATQAGAYNMSKAEALKYGAVYSNLISGFAKDTGETMKYTEDLLKSSAVVASGTGRSMEDVMDRIRSGMLGNTEAIEDLGINVNVAMIQSTDAFKKFANGKSWQQIDYQTQQQIRLMAILEQSNKKYGDSLGQNTATSMQQFVAQLKNIQLSLGQAFLPILNAILPALTALASRLASVMGVVAQFVQALFGKTKDAQAQATATAKQASAVGGLGEAYKKAGKEAKGALSSIDEINSVSPSSGGSSEDGGGDGGAMAMPSMPTLDASGFTSGMEDVSSKAIEMANKVKAVFGSIADFISSNKDIIVSAVSGIVAGFAAFQVISNWTSIITTLQKAVSAIGATMGAISLPILAVAAAIALVVGSLVYLWQTNDGFKASVIEAWNSISGFVTTIVTDMWTIIQGIWQTYGQSIMDGLAGFMMSIQNIILSVWEGFLKPVITAALEFLTNLWNNHLKDFVSVLFDVIAKLVVGVMEIWNKFIAPIVGFLIDVLGPVFAAVFKGIIAVIGPVVGFIIDVAKQIFKILGGIIDFVVGVFTGNWGKAWDGIKAIFKGVWDALVAIVKFPLNLIIGGINLLIKGLNSLKIEVPDWVPFFGGKTYSMNIPEIPKLAKGGVVTSPTHAIVGDAGAEAVMPLERNTGWIDVLASKINSSGSSSSDQPAIFIFKVGETEFGRVAINSINKAQRQSGELLLNI